jgi:hypothetical protein
MKKHVDDLICISFIVYLNITLEILKCFRLMVEVSFQIILFV